MGIYRRRSVRCTHCSFAGYCGDAYFEWGTFRLGSNRYKSVQFLMCLKCGLVHAYGSSDIGLKERSPLFAQPELLRTRKAPSTVWRGGESFEEWVDGISPEASYVECPQQVITEPDWQERVEGVLVACGWPCAHCGSEGELADLLLRAEQPVRCPCCVVGMLEHF
jgi:hypothetical protein